MNTSVRRSTASAAATALLLGGAVACGGGSGTEVVQRSAAQVLTAAFEKTSEAKSARVSMTVSVPKSMEDGGEMTMTGVMGWDPTVMDMTIEGSALAMDPEAPDEMRVVLRDNVMYIDGGAAAAKEMDGKRWMKLDYEAMAEESGNEELAKQMTAGLADMNQDPTQQLAMLLDSPNLKHVGSEKIDGKDAQHYKGTLTVEEMVKSSQSESLELLDAKEREKLFDNMEKSGIKGFDTEVWVNDDDLPVRMDVDIDSPEGTVEMSMRFSDYGAKTDVYVPPASETFDLLEMFRESGELDEPDEADLG